MLKIEIHLLPNQVEMDIAVMSCFYPEVELWSALLEDRVLIQLDTAWQFLQEGPMSLVASTVGSRLFWICVPRSVAPLTPKWKTNFGPKGRSA